jgi:hypothetical protein
MFFINTAGREENLATDTKLGKFWSKKSRGIARLLKTAFLRFTLPDEIKKVGSSVGFAALNLEIFAF